MHHIAEIKQVKETNSGTRIEIFIPDKFLETQIERFKQDKKAYANIRLDDGRMIRSSQQRKYWATVNDIADYTGHLGRQLDDYFKMLYRCMVEDVDISMSDCTVTQAREMINIVMDFALTRDVPLSDVGVNRAEDVDRYLYLCILKRKCVCCGKSSSDFHHTEAVGMGRDRKKINHVGMSGLTLCRKHHNEIHQMGEVDFSKKHRVYPLKLDEYAVKKLKL